MFSSDWFAAMGISNAQAVKIAAWIGISLVLAVIVAVLLASPVMSALGLSSLRG